MAEIKKAKERVNFGKINLADESPDLLDIQLSTFKEFFQIETTTDNRSKEGLYQVFMENFPISDTRSIFVLEFFSFKPFQQTITLNSQIRLIFSNSPLLSRFQGSFKPL